VSITAAASLACQRAAYTALHGALTDPNGGAVVPVYDEVPEDAAFPYVAIGPAVSTPQNRFGRRGRLVIQQLDVWTRSGPDAAQDGWAEAKGIAAQIEELLDWTQPATSDGWVFTDCLMHREQEKREPDGITRCVVCEYQFRLEVAVAP
jgi:hypothetical protein